MIDSDNHYSELWELQSGLCAICGKPGKPAGLVVDHDHRTALIRGLLCPSCNTLEGMVGDSLKFEAYRLHPPAEGRGWVYCTVFGPAEPERSFTPDELSEDYSRVFPDKEPSARTSDAPAANVQTVESNAEPGPSLAVDSTSRVRIIRASGSTA